MAINNESRDGHMAHNEQTFTLGELTQLYEDIRNSKGGSIVAIVDDIPYETDWGYGLEGIDHFITMLKRRHGIKVD